MPACRGTAASQRAGPCHPPTHLNTILLCVLCRMAAAATSYLPTGTLPQALVSHSATPSEPLNHSSATHTHTQRGRSPPRERGSSPAPRAASPPGILRAHSPPALSGRSSHASHAGMHEPGDVFSQLGGALASSLLGGIGMGGAAASSSWPRAASPARATSHTEAPARAASPTAAPAHTATQSVAATPATVSAAEPAPTVSGQGPQSAGQAGASKAVAPERASSPTQSRSARHATDPRAVHVLVTSSMPPAYTPNSVRCVSLADTIQPAWA